KIVAPADAQRAFRPPRYFPAGGDFADGVRPVRYVISSGSVLSLDAFDEVESFRSDFFIDAIDTEWCFRAWSRGYSVWVDETVRLEHRIGAGAGEDVLFASNVPFQSPMRVYAYVRNQVHCLTLSHIPAWWKALLC